eukprot:5507636-Ditylum_brightwellii.AAC.1
MMEQNMTATNNMIQALVSAAFSSTQQGASSAPQSALGVRHVEHSFASDAAENEEPYRTLYGG